MLGDLTCASHMVMTTTTDAERKNKTELSTTAHVEEAAADEVEGEDVENEARVPSQRPREVRVVAVPPQVLRAHTQSWQPAWTAGLL